MHIPDGLLETKIWLSLAAVSGGATAVTLNRVTKKISDRQIPVIGVLSAFILAAQMFDFPVGAGASGHFLGAALSAILFGPFTGLLIMTTVLIIQCLIFQDGGLTALGANVFNMGITGSFLSYFVYRAFSGILHGKRGISAGAFAAAWLSMVLCGAAVSAELSLSGIVPSKPAFIVMLSAYAVTGIVEGIITVTAISFISKVRPDILAMEKI